MLISPPFIPTPIANENDQEFLNRAMVCGEPGSGAFPISHDMGWHGGVHLTAPAVADGHSPVRTIADGEVAYFRIASAPNNILSNAQNYGGGWTDNGCLVVKHETETGENADASLVFYSIYMHLSSITLANIHIGQRVHRKDVLGQAGSIYGVSNKIHFEIICSQDQVSKIIGRSSGDTSTTSDGRTDSLWGDTHFYVPSEVLFYAERPANPRSATNESAIVHHSDITYFVRMSYSQGQCKLTTFDEKGVQQAERDEVQNFEYELYSTACHLYPQSPSAGYELLKFGRILGPVQLQPTDAAHWRQVAYAGGVGWVNLNSTTVAVYSDADFPHWQRWKLINDDTNGDGRCQSLAVMNLLGLSEIPITAEQRAECNALVVLPENQEKLKRLVCKFPSEWVKGAFDARYNWLREGNSPIVSADNFQRLKAHYEALSFWEEANLIGIDSEHWHFPPKEFLMAFRRCGWLSLDELVSTFPKHLFYHDSGNPRVAYTENNSIYTLTKATARTRVSAHRVELNKTVRKYLGGDKKRLAIFLAQVLLETAQWRNIGGTRRLMHEWGFGTYNANNPETEFYTVFYGRGIMQLTWAGNYKSYGEFRGLSSHTGAYIERRQNIQPRLTATSTHYNQNPSEGGTQFTWAPRYDPDLVGENVYEACDSGGFYWVFRPFSEGININRVADRSYSADNTGFVNRLVNGGGNGYYERQAYTAFILRKLTDSTEVSLQVNISPTNKSTVRASMLSAE